MGKRKERSLVELYKRTVKMSKPRVTPILQGNCRMQGPLDEFGPEFETDMPCSTEDRVVEESLVATMDCSTSTNASLQCNNEIQKCTVDLPSSTCDERLSGMGVTTRESSDDHCIEKSATRNIAEREETSGTVKTRVNRNTRRARGSKIRKTDRARNHADYKQDVEERKSLSIIKGNEKLLEGTEISQSSFKEGIPSSETKSEESHEKCSTDKVFDILKSVGDPHNGDIDPCCHEDNVKEQVRAEREIPSVEQNDVNNVDSRDSDSIETYSDKKSPDTCNMPLISVENQITEEKTLSKELPELTASVSFKSFNGFDSDLHLPASESAGILETHLNGDLCNAEDIKENPTKLENTDNLSATHTESHAETNITLAEGMSGSPSMVDSENVTTSALLGKMHSGKEAFGKIEDTVDVIGKMQLACGKDELLLHNANIEARTSTNAIESTADGYCNHSSPGYSLSLAGVEHVDMAVEYGPLDHSSSSSLHKGEPSNRHPGEENISQEAFSSFPHSITPGQSSVTSHASQRIVTTKEIEAHSSCQQEDDFVFTCSPEPTEISSTKKPISTVEEAKDVAPVLPEVLPKDPDYHRDECVKSNFSSGFRAISGVPGICSESGNDINHVPIEVGPDRQLEHGEQVKTVAKEDTFHDTEIKLEEDFHIDKANINVGPSEMASCSEDSLLCQSLLEKTCGPLSVEDDVKVCDICGDTGYEEMLAVCSMCNDGAEHIYCMPIMLDEVPEGDWLCEGCKLQQNANVKRVETPPNLRMMLKPACLTSRKHNYGALRSRLSAKLDKMKLGPDRQRAIKGTLSSQVSTKRQAEGFVVGSPMKKLAFQASNGHSGSLISNAKHILCRENSFKASNITKVKISTTVSPTANSLSSSSSLHDSDISSALLKASSPSSSTKLQSSKNKSVSSNGLATDPSAFTGTSKAGNSVSSTGLAALTGKSSTDRTLPPARFSNIEKLSASPKIVNDFTKSGYHGKAARENTSNICTVGGFSKSLKSTTNSNLSALSESMLTSDIQNVKIKEMRTGKVRRDVSDISRSKSMAMPSCISSDPVSTGVANFENLATDGICVKPLTCEIKDSSKSIRSEEKKAVASTQVLPHSNKKEHSSIRSSGEGQAQLKALPSRIQEGAATNKLQQSASIEVVHNIAAKNLKSLSHTDTTSLVKLMAEGNVSSSIEDSKRNSCTRVVAEGYPSEHSKKGGSLHSKTSPNNNLVQETKKSGNSENFSSLKLSSRNHTSVVGTTRCYKCKQLGHSAQSCTKHSPAEAGSNRSRVSTRISPTRSSKEISDNGIHKLNTPEEIAFPGNITECKNSQSSGKKQLNFDSDVRDHVQWAGSDSPRQVSGIREMSYADHKLNSTLLSKGTTDLNGKLDFKNPKNQEFSASNVDLAGCSIGAPQTLASRPWKSPLYNHSSAASKINEESISHTGSNERKRTDWVANSQKYLYQRRLEEGEGRFLSRDSSHISTAAITQPAVLPAEGTVVAIGGSTSYRLPSASDASYQPHTESRVVPRPQSSHPETVKATILPEHNFLWQGGFEVRNKENSFNYFGGIQAHASTCAAPKVLDAVKKFSSKLQLEEVPRCSSWPWQFQYSHPSDESIALYFFAKDHESYGKSYQLLLEHILKNDFALRGNFDGVELLVFPSNQLPQKSQRWNRLLFLWGVFRGRNSSCSESSTCAAAFSAAEGMDSEKDGGGESCTRARALRTLGNELSPSASDQGEKQNGSCLNIPNTSSVKDRKVCNAQKSHDDSSAHLVLVENNSTRFSDLDLPPGFETLTAKKPCNVKDHIICQSKSTQEDGSGKIVDSGTNEEVSSSHKTCNTEKINFNSGYTPGPSDISLSSTEKLTYSCVTSRIAVSDSPGQRSEIGMGKRRVRDSENVSEMERTKEMEFDRLRPNDGDMDQESRLHEKDSENNWAIVVEGEKEMSLSSSKQEDYINHKSKRCRDGRPERYHSHISHTCSPPGDGVQSHSPKLQIHSYEQQNIQMECPDLDLINHLQSSSGKKVHEKIHEFVGSPIEKSSNDIAVGQKEEQRKLKKSEGEIQGRQSIEERGESGSVSAEPKMADVRTYQIADLNRVPDYESALDFSGTHVQHHIQQVYPDYQPSVADDSKVTEMMSFSGPKDIRVNYRSKPSEWTTGRGSKQNSSGPSSSGQFVAIAEENIQEKLDLNIPILELSLGGKKSSSNPVILTSSTSLLPNSPIKSSLIEGNECGSSLSLSLPFPLSQKDQTAKTLKGDQPNPANCSVNTSICLFGRRVDC